jgi:TPP-dependent pyruvate/acetoin dehydrogenase alpha subunit
VAVEEAARRAIASIRGGGSPVFLECRTYRFRAHSMYDPELYREKSEVEAWKQRDPLLVLANREEAAGVLDDATVAAIEAAVADEIDTAVAFAEEAAFEPLEELTRFVYSEDGR